MANEQTQHPSHVYTGVCIFRREKHSEVERGICIGTDAADIWQIVSVKNFKPLDKEPYFYRALPTEGCFVTYK